MIEDFHGNRFEIVALVRKRANAISHGAEPLVPARRGDNPVSTALWELRAGEIRAGDSDVARDRR